MRRSADEGAALNMAAKETASTLGCHTRVAAALFAGALLLAGCGTSTTDRALSGAGIGAGAGLVVGAVAGIPAAGAAVGALAGVGVGVATTPEKPAAETAPHPEPPPNPDRAVTTHLSKGQGLTAARKANRRAAGRACGGGFVLVGESRGEDAQGTWVQLIYGCLAHAQDHAGQPNGQTSSP